ncbi:MAG TPA: DUF1330 domain-containing protein [Porticoccus sp.]|nr:DUF1330 domain-containing protein [Porticoccus sp.]
MKVLNKVSNTPKQIEALLHSDDEGPVCMVNLIKFKEKAVYEDGRETNLSGAQAYEIYGLEIAKMVHGLGGEIVFSSTVTGLVVGEVEELWDAIAIAKYPSRKAFVKFINSPEFVKHLVHRTAGLDGQLNIASRQMNA